jgi:DMSO/TMAO reductase YedYZ molybdopterin-dependent catalytic subunit
VDRERLVKKQARLTGALAGTVALAAMWLLTSVVTSARFAPAIIADLLIRSTPGDLATYFIEGLGHWAMRLLIVVVIAGVIVFSGEALFRTASGERLRPWRGALVLGVLGMAVILLGPEAGANRLASSAAVLMGTLVFAGTARFFTSQLGASPTDSARRRTFRLALGGAAALTVAGGLAGWLARRLSGPNTDVDLVGAPRPATIPEREAWPRIPGITPEVTATDDHYVVDINLFAPVIEAEGWTLDVRGLVDSPREFTFGSLQESFQIVEEYSVLCCVSNEVGGDLIGHSRWGGVRLADLLEDVGVREGAVDVVFRAADDYADSIPIEIARAPSTLLTVSQNGRPLTQEHGFPCRVRVPSIYGMKNVKWLTSIEVVGSDYTGYWQTRGWSDEAVIKTQSRIDVPEDGTSLVAKKATWVAGIAWAGDRDISKVEVSVDGGRSWESARLREPIAANSWRQWAYSWTPGESGDFTLVCRATDGEGVVQTSKEVPPHPAGASGYHTIEVGVT